MIYSLENENAARSTKIFHSSLVSSCAYSRSLDLAYRWFDFSIARYLSFVYSSISFSFSFLDGGQTSKMKLKVNEITFAIFPFNIYFPRFSISDSTCTIRWKFYSSIDTVDKRSKLPFGRNFCVGKNPPPSKLLHSLSLSFVQPLIP